MLSEQEVATYLHLTVSQVRDLVRTHDIPCNRQGDRVVFQKIAIDAWASKRLLGSKTETVENFHKQSSMVQHNLSDTHAILPDLMKPDYVSVDLDCRTKNSVMRKMVQKAEATGLLIYPQELLLSLEERERLGSTALGGGVALMHPQHHDPYMFEDSFVVFGRTIQPLHFGSPDDQRTDLYFLVCCQDDSIHLHVLARLCMMAYHTTLLMDLRDAESSLQAYEIMCASENDVVAGKL